MTKTNVLETGIIQSAFIPQQKRVELVIADKLWSRKEGLHYGNFRSITTGRFIQSDIVLLYIKKNLKKRLN